VIPWFYDERIRDGAGGADMRDLSIYIPEFNRIVGGRVYFGSKIDTCFSRNEKVIKIDSVSCITWKILKGMPWTYRHIIRTAIKRVLFGEYIDWGFNFENNQPMTIRIRIPSCFQGIRTLRKPDDTCFTIRPCPFDLPCCDVTYTLVKDAQYPDSIKIQNIQINTIPESEDICSQYYNIPCGLSCVILNEGERIRWIVLDVQNKKETKSNEIFKFSSNVIFLEFTTSQYKIEIFDVIGNMIYFATNNKTQINIDMNNFPSGIYFIKLTNLQNGEISFTKFVKVN